MTIRRRVATLFLAIGVAGSSAGAALAAQPVIVDTDLGSGLDDTFALALLLKSPELQLRAVTLVSGDTAMRSRIACRYLTAADRREVPVAAGAVDSPPQALGGMQLQYGRHPAVTYNRTSKAVPQSPAELMYAQLKEHPGEITLIALGPLTNLAKLLQDHPDAKPWIKQIVLTAGTVASGELNNLQADREAAQAVLTSGVPLLVVELMWRERTTLDDATRERIFRAGGLINQQVESLYQLCDRPADPPLDDAVTVALCVTEQFCSSQKERIEVDERGLLRKVPGEPNARVVSEVDQAAFLQWFGDRLVADARERPTPEPNNASKLIERRGMPTRVHAFEDFETDIEKKWWMSGVGETADCPPGSTRCGRGVLTLDFDGKSGDLSTLFNAVIFNPVPGPPMGPRTRLTFRYRLKGTDALRVQIYSLSNGYHRCLTLAGLPQERWEWGTVDMTEARRPDGSGGPLAEGERIDDIQFYADAGAELLVDDIVLYDEAQPNETRPYPNRLLFTGWFDSGKQGQEWPGDFAIAANEGFYRNAAKSVENPETKTPWIRLGLRGSRPAGAAATHLSFRYRLTGDPPIAVSLRDSQTDVRRDAVIENPKIGKWAEAVVELGPGEMQSFDELHFNVSQGAELLVDDVLLYEPGAADSIQVE